MHATAAARDRSGIDVRGWAACTPWRVAWVFGQDGVMQFAGVLPEDAPDPRLEREARLKDMPVPIVDLVPQPSVEFADFGVSTSRGGSGVDATTVSVSATLWRTRPTSPIR